MVDVAVVSGVVVPRSPTRLSLKDTAGAVAIATYDALNELSALLNWLSDQCPKNAVPPTRIRDTSRMRILSFILQLASRHTPNSSV